MKTRRVTETGGPDQCESAAKITSCELLDSRTNLLIRGGILSRPFSAGHLLQSGNNIPLGGLYRRDIQVLVASLLWMFEYGYHRLAQLVCVGQSESFVTAIPDRRSVIGKVEFQEAITKPLVMKEELEIGHQLCIKLYHLPNRTIQRWQCQSTSNLRIPFL